MNSLFPAAVAAVLVGLMPAQADTFFVCHGDDSIVRVAGDSATVFATGLKTPQGMAEDRTGNLYIANYNGGEIIEFRVVNGALSNRPIVFASGLHAPMDLTFDRAGNLYEADQGSGTINKFAGGSAGLSHTPEPVLTGLTDNNKPSGVCFDSSGNLYVAAYIGGILKFANTGGKLETTPTIFSTISRARQMTLDKMGNLWTADHVEQRLYEFVRSGAGLSSAPKLFAEKNGLFAPIGVVFDSSGNLYAANWGYGSGTDVVEYPMEGGVLSSTPDVFVGGLSSPTYILYYAPPGACRVASTTAPQDLAESTRAFVARNWQSKAHAGETVEVPVTFESNK